MNTLKGLGKDIVAIVYWFDDHEWARVVYMMVFAGLMGYCIAGMVMGG